jgi:hypothetical protein
MSCRRIMRLLCVIVLTCFTSAMALAKAGKILIPMNSTQTNHLKAYGVAFAELQEGRKVDWLLNYKGGAFVMDNSDFVTEICKFRDVSYVRLNNSEYERLLENIIKPDFKKEVVVLTKPPHIAVYTPANKGPWDDAVTLALTYAEIPFDKLYVDEVMAGKLDKYDWLHLHHEDFTGQQGKYWATARNTDWYQNEKWSLEQFAAKHNFKKISQMQLAIVKKIQAFISNGGNMFAMCSATDTYDIALAADGVDICTQEFDGDPMDAWAQSKLDFGKCLAFQNFKISTNPAQYEFSDIDNTDTRKMVFMADSFIVNTQAAKFDPIVAMLCQNHIKEIKGFMGQTTAFRLAVIKPDVQILASTAKANEARLIHGTYGNGSFTFYGGHDPEDYSHTLGDPPTALEKTPGSPGYRLILNNVLFPAAKKKNIPTIVYDEKAPEPAKVVEPVKGSVESRVKIFPGPTPGELIVSISPGKIDQMVMMSADGREVLRKSGSSDQISIDMNTLQTGMYMIMVNGEYAGKVMKN